jgi:hypothetical protein
MKMLMSVSIPNEKFNRMVENGTIGAKIGKILEAIKPEAVYFTEQNGHRGAIIAVEVADSSKIPGLAEPWFLAFDAQVRFHIAMTPDDLKKSGIDAIGKMWS